MTGAQSSSEDIPARAVRTLGRQVASPGSQDDTTSGSNGGLTLRMLRYITFAPQLPCMLRAEGVSPSTVDPSLRSMLRWVVRDHAGRQAKDKLTAARL
ncbi:hypothetical protein An16g00340 [Aspergillus niger]|uniref:Uncharacterized protein n=2 Tax=Aspergillus niger TaxID=5061 RepID=A2R6K6_ASPNC|nr:hypothetical protein An16g00340 [Aspergillus niger]CAK42714.1 hypothetical protein An16g00340 [Aspergillus niger]